MNNNDSMNSRRWLVWLGGLLVVCATACGRADEAASRGPETLATTGEGLDNGVPVGSLSGLKNTEQLFTIEVPEGMSRLVVTLTRSVGDPDLYIRKGSAPTTTTYDCRSNSSGTLDECSVTSPQPGTWYVMVRAYSDYSGASLVASYTPATSVLAAGQSVTVSGAAGSQRFWTLEVPASQTVLRVRMSGGTGNADLYVNQGTPPTTTTAACASAQSSNVETCSINTPVAGTWYVLVRGVTDFSGANLTVSSHGADGTAVMFVANDTTVTLPRAEAGDAFHYALEVPAGQTQLRVRTHSGSSANANLYVRYGDKASLTAYDCRSEGSYAEEDCVITNPQAGTWFILIHSKQATQLVSFQAVYSNGTLPPIELANGKPFNLTTFPNATPRVYTVQVPAGHAKLRVSVSTSTATVYGRLGAVPVQGSSSSNQCSYGSSCEVIEPQAGTWYFLVVPSYTFDNDSLVARYSGELSAPVALVNGQALTGISASRGDIRYYTVNVPTGQGRLVIDMLSGGGWPDFFIRSGSRPTSSNYSCSKAAVSGMPTSCVFDAPASGLWYIQMKAGDRDVADTAVKATYSPLSPRTTTQALSNGQWVNNLSGTPMVDAFFTLSVPANQQALTLETLPGAGDVRVYLKRGAEPTSSDYDCVDRCERTFPASGTWYARVRARENYSGWVFRLAYQPVTELPLETWVGPMVMDYYTIRYFRVEVPSGLSSLTLEASAPGGRTMNVTAVRGSVPAGTVNCNVVQGDGGRRCVFANPLAGTWFVRVESDYTVEVPDVKLRARADRLPTSTVGLTDNGALSVDVLAGQVQAYTLQVPAGQAALDVDLLTQDDGELLLQYGRAPDSNDSKCRAVSTRAQPGATCSVPAPSAGTWYAVVKAAPGFQGRLRATTTSRRALVNGVPEVAVSGAQGQERLYQLEVPAGMSDLSFTLRDATRTSQLLVRYGTPPAGTTADCTFTLVAGRPEETCAFSQPAAGTWYVTVRGASGAFSGAVLTGTYVATPGEGVASLSRGVTVAGVQGGGYERKLWKLEVPAGQAVLKFDLLGTNGAPDLYVQHGARPTTTTYACSAPGGTVKAATCTVQNPAAGTWFVMARALSGYSGAYLTGTYWQGTESLPLTRGVPLPNLSGTPDLAQYFQVEVPPGQSFLSLDLFGSVANAVMTARQGVLPTAADTACAVKTTTRRACEFANPTAGTWYVRLGGTFSGVALSADHVGLGATDGIQPLMNNGTFGTAACIQSSKPMLFKLEVPSGMSKLTVSTTGGSGCGGSGPGIDLRVMLGSPPTLSDYDCLSNNADSNETCTLKDPVAGTWYVLVSGDASGMSVVGQYE